MITFEQFLLEARSIGKKMDVFYVHKDYVDKTKIPLDLYIKAVKVLKKEDPKFEYTIVKWNPKNNDFSFLYSPDWDESDEPYIKDSYKISEDGSISYTKPKSDPQIYHQKWQFVGDDYKGFDIEQSKERTKRYTAAIAEIAKEKGIPTKQISSRIGYKSYWEKEVVPYIKD